METQKMQPAKIVEVFKTNVPDAFIAEKLLAVLRHCFPGSRINFDLTDCDKVLRVETSRPSGEKIKQIVRENGYRCEELQ
jgi:hypothetical protein